MTDTTDIPFGTAYEFIKNNNITAFKRALQENRITITQTDKNGYSFIHAGLESNNLETLKKVIKLFPEKTVEQADEKDHIMTHALINITGLKARLDNPVSNSVFMFFAEECIRITRKSTNLRFSDKTANPNSPQPL